MKLIVGLGNPGPQYETTRHNIGFLAVDYLIDQWKASGPSIKNKAQVWTATVDGEQLLIIKPQTFMNLSGQSVGPFFQFYKCEPKDVIVVYDELDIDPNDIRFKIGGSNGGHNGLKSIDAALGGDNLNYVRVRLGIGHPRNFNPRIDVSDWVLGQIQKEQWDGLEDLFKKVEAGIKLVFKDKINMAMNQFHRK